jgi:hypothetical protein
VKNFGHVGKITAPRRIGQDAARHKRKEALSQFASDAL